MIVSSFSFGSFTDLAPTFTFMISLGLTFLCGVKKGLGSFGFVSHVFPAPFVEKMGFLY